ncbi:MAG: UDP-N-acetylmuramoyl-tripeptide--D-alanyl-D-alanine ligase [Nitrospirales bacterium]
MAVFEVAEIVQATGGTLVIGGGTRRHFRNIQTDSRHITKGDLFVALQGGQFDGHQFVAKACQSGAAGAIVAEAQAWEVLRNIRKVGSAGAVFTLVAVKDTLRAYQELGAFHRQRFSIPVVAITGSNGKTTTKEMVSGVLSVRWRVLKTQGNFNNAIGVPKTLLRLNGTHQAAVVEMGVDQVGQTTQLCQIVKPTSGVITNVGPDHLEFYGTLARSAASKRELLPCLPSNGTAILNADDKYCAQFVRKAPCRVVSFGFSPHADIRGSQVTWDGRNTEFWVSFPHLKKPKRAVVRTMGRHNISNALAGIATGWTLGVSPSDILEGLESFRPAPMRSEIRRWGGVVYLNDCYNANPASVKAALDVLVSLDPAKRTIAVLGDMLELGPQESQFHEDIGRYAARKGVSHLIACGRFGAVMKAGAEKASRIIRVVQTKDAAEAGWVLQSIVKPKDVVLVKASRGARMERVLEVVKGR